MWGLCWTCGTDCAWSSIHVVPVEGRPPQRSLLTNHALFHPPPACEDRWGETLSRREFDSRGRLVSYEYPGIRGQLRWNASGLVAHRRGNDESRWVRTEGGEPLRVDYVELDGAGQVLHHKARTEWTYDDEGRLLSRWSYAGNLRVEGEAYTFDAAGRTTRMARVSNGQPWERVIAYDSEGRPTRWGDAPIHRDPQGQWTLTRVGEPRVERWRIRDGRVRAYESETAGGTVRVVFQTDAKGRTIEERYTVGPTVSPHRFVWGPFGVTEEHLDGDVTASWVYDAAGHVTALRDANGFGETMTYDPMGRITSHRRTHPTRLATTFERSWRWSDEGRLIAAQVRYPGATHGVFNLALTYEDDLLAEARLTEPPPWSTRMDYDYRCLREVFANMPRRAFTERQPARPWTDVEILEGNWPGWELRAMPWRHRVDRADWPLSL